MQQTKRDSKTLLHVVAECLVAETDLGLVTHFTELVKSIIDAESMSLVCAALAWGVDITYTDGHGYAVPCQANERTDMLRLFYDECADTLTQPLAQLPGPPASAYLQDKGAAIYATLELMTVFVAQHAHYMKTHLLRSTVIVKAAQLLNCNRAHLALGMGSASMSIHVCIVLTLAFIAV